MLLFKIKKMIGKETDIQIKCHYDGTAYNRGPDYFGSRNIYKTKWEDNLSYRCFSKTDFKTAYSDLVHNLHRDNFYLKNSLIEISGKISGKEVQKKFADVDGLYSFLKENHLCDHYINHRPQI